MNKELKEFDINLEILSDNEHYSNAVLYGKINKIIDYINGSDKE